MRLVQVVTAGVLGVVDTVLFTSTKSSLLYLLARKHKNIIKQWYAAIFIVLILPEVITLLRTIWGTSFAVRGRMSNWPSWKAIFLGVFTTLVESAALTFFTLEVAPQLPGYMVLPFMNALLFLQIILEQWKRNRNVFVITNTAEPWARVARTLQTMASAFGICVFILTSCLLVIFHVTGIRQTISLVAATVVLSVVWCQPVRSYIFSSNSPCQQARQNISFLLNLLRIFSLGSFVIMIIPMNGDVEFPEVPAFVWEGITSLGRNHVLTSAVIINCCCGGFSYVMTRLSSYYTTTLSGILVPTVISTTLSSALHAYNCLDDRFLTLDLICPLTDGSLIVTAFVALLWLLPILILRKRYFLPADTLFKPEHENFIVYGYNGICFDQHLFLNYYPCTSIYGTTRHSNARSRVFVCTTMYREADYEMEQLLRSLSKISKSKRLKKKNIYLEAHIFLDNGASGLTMKEFALQLMSLIETCLGVGRSDGNILRTPYGIQISSYLPEGMPLFVHLKDSRHVKAKKRWSQVMYLNYIMEHRIKITSQIHNLDVQMMQVKKQEIQPSRNTEMILQIKYLSQSLKAQDEDSEISHGRSINSKFGSEESSDQGIETGDDMSVISNLKLTASQRETLKVKDDSESRSVFPLFTTSSCTNLPAEEYPVGITTATDLSKSPYQIDIEKQIEYLDDSRSNTHLSKACSYASLVSVDYPTGKINPAYIPNENEMIPPKWLFQFISSSGDVSAVPRILDLQGPVRDSCSEGYGKDDNLSTISTDAAFVDLSEGISHSDERTYILATDADMHFNDMSVLDLVDTCNDDLRLGAACGRTHPMGEKIHPIVWFQKFEYAKDFWLIKSAQNIIGSVMCCPGCFSLYRVKALEAVLPLYSEPIMKPGEVFTKDTGEDRWMCTLMMMRGWKLRYSNFSYNGTYCPDNVDEFIKQRRRWILSDFANSLMVFKNLPHLIRNNGCFSLIYAIYIAQLFFVEFLSPGSTVIVMTVGLDMLLGFNFFIVTPVVTFILIGYGFMCMRLSSQAQLRLTKILMVVLGLSMSAVVVGAAVFVIRDVIKDIQGDTLQPREHYILLILTGGLFYAALLHPNECLLLVNGIFYLFFLPATHILLPVYALCNIVDQTWGTRDNQKAKIPKRFCFPKLRFKKKKKKKNQSSGDQDTAREDSEVSGDQLKQMEVNEYTFWNTLVEKLIGNGANLGLEKAELTRELRALRLKAVLSILFANLAWIIGLGLFYKSFLQQENTLTGYGLMNGILYGFSFCIQVVGMTVCRIQDSTHRLGKKIFKSDKPHWITQRVNQ